MIYVILALVLIGFILTWKPYVKPKRVPPSEQVESTYQSNETPVVKSNQAYLEERTKPDKYLTGVWGVESNQMNLRSPYHIASYKRAELLQKVFQEARASEDETEFESVKQKLQDVERDYKVDFSILTKNQQEMLQSITDGQGVPARVAGDALEDERMSVKELQAVFPMFGISKERPDFLSFKKYSIQTKPGSAEALMEKALN